MTAKEYLQQYGHAIKRTHAISDHLAELRSVCEQLRTEDGKRVALDKAVAELVDAQEKTAAEITQLCRLETEIACTIDRLPEPYRTLLFERYINGKTFEQIAVFLNYSYRQVTRIHGNALNLVKDDLECPT